MTKTYVRNQAELIALLRLAGYTEVQPISNMIYTHKNLPTVTLGWVNGCHLSTCDQFLTFSEAWEIISTEANDGH